MTEIQTHSPLLFFRPPTSFSTKRQGIKRAIVLLLSLFLFNGCVAIGLFYSLADDFISWEVDRFLDLTKEQDRFVDQQLALIISRHQSEEIPKYEAFLRDIKRRLGRNLNERDVVWFMETIDKLYFDIALLFADAATGLLSEVSPTQLKHLETELAEDNEEWLEKRTDRAEERPRKRMNRIYDNIEDWLGSLTKDQKSKISQLYGKRIEDGQIRYQYRLERQRRFLSIIRRSKSKSEMRANLLNWIRNPEVDYTDKYKQLNQAWKSRMFKLVVLLEETDTPKQRDYLINKIDDYLSQLKKLRQN